MKGHARDPVAMKNCMARIVLQLMNVRHDTYAGVRRNANRGGEAKSKAPSSSVNGSESVFKKS